MSVTPEPHTDRRRSPASCEPGALLRLDPMDRIRVLRAGIESVVLVAIAHATGRSPPELIDLLQLMPPSPGTTFRKGARLTTEQSERVLAFLRLIERVEAMVTSGGDDRTFDAARWLGDWLTTPCPALGGQRPAVLTDTLEGYRVLDHLLAQMLSGAYA